MSGMNLEKTLAKAQADESAFKEIYDLTINQVFSFVLLRIGNRELALDICQNIYSDMWQYLPRFTYMGDAHFYAFLFKVARRQIIKTRKKNPPHVDLETLYDIRAEEKEHEDYRTLLREMHKLNENEKSCLELRYYQDLSFFDVALRLGITENNAKVLHHRALKKLKENLKIYE